MKWATCQLVSYTAPSEGWRDVLFIPRLAQPPWILSRQTSSLYHSVSWALPGCLLAQRTQKLDTPTETRSSLLMLQGEELLGFMSGPEQSRTDASATGTRLQRNWNPEPRNNQGQVLTGEEPLERHPLPSSQCSSPRPPQCIGRAIVSG